MENQGENEVIGSRTGQETMGVLYRARVVESSARSEVVGNFTVKE